MPDKCLFYIHDPMCSWCYAFRSSLDGLRKDLPATIQIVNVLGGLAPDTTEPMQAELQNTIQQTWRRIEKTVPTIHFNHDFWLLNTPYRSTYPACRAILAARKQGAEFESKIGHAIQTAYYRDAKNPSLQAILAECATDIGLDAVDFMNDLTDPIIESELQSEIRMARSMGVSSYPSLRLLQGETWFPVAVDYLNHRTMINEITEILKKASI